MSRLHFPKQSVTVGLLALFFFVAAAEALYASGNYGGGFSGGASTSEGIPDLAGAGNGSRDGLPGSDTPRRPGRSTTSTPPGRFTTPPLMPWSNPGTNRTTRPPVRPPMPVFPPLPPIKNRPVMDYRDQNRIKEIQRAISNLKSQRQRMTNIHDYRDAGEKIWRLEQEFFRIKNRYITNPQDRFEIEDKYFRPFDSLPRGRSSTGAP